MATTKTMDVDAIRQLVSYDAETGLFVWRERDVSMFRQGDRQANACAVWNARFAGRPAFNCANSNGYLSGRINGVIFGAHRVAYALHHGKWPPHDIDHINGDKTDNRASNIRAVTEAENMRNRAISKNNASGFMGVSWDGRRRKWAAYVTADGRKRTIGRFNELSDAVDARKSAERLAGYHENHGRNA